MQKIYPCLWFDRNAEQAVDYYLSIFPDSRRLVTSRYGKDGRLPEGTALTITFEIGGQKLMALNGGPGHQLSEAMSICVNCTTQGEVDELWEKLSAGGQKQPCGWLKDQFGLSWQLTTPEMDQMLGDPDPARVERVFRAAMQMTKPDLALLRSAYQAS